MIVGGLRKVALDMQIPSGFERLFKIREVQVFHAASKFRRQTRNGELLHLLSADGAGVLLTCDNDLFYQQNYKTLPLAVITIFTADTHMKTLQTYLPEISSLLASSLEKRFYCAGVQHPKRKEQEKILLNEYRALYPADSIFHNQRKTSRT